MQEKRKPVKGYENLYEVSNLGRVRSRKVVRSQFKKPNGYMVVELWKNNVGKHFYVHRLVATAFIENVNNEPQVNHKDGNKQNNCVSNLEWCDNRYNNQHSYDHLNRIRLKGELNKKSKLIDVYKDGVLVYSGYSLRMVGKAMGVHPDSIWRCCIGKYKQAGGYVFKYRG